MLRFLLVVASVWALSAPAMGQTDPPQGGKDNIAGPYVPTPWEIVDEMLKLGDVGSNDVLYDLGSGDGRLVITAAKRHGARSGRARRFDPVLAVSSRPPDALPGQDCGARDVWRSPLAEGG